jgi:hypothetical protein
MCVIGSKLGSALWVLACSLALYANACAKSEDPPGNGQSHWLQSCDDDDDCGDLSCECGVCTIPCADDDTCTMSGITCRSASTLASGECSGDIDAPMLCLNDELAVLPEAVPPDPEDSGAPDTGMADADVQLDAAIIDAEITDAELADASDDANRPPLSDALQIGCDAIEDDQLPPGVELIDTALNSNFSHVRASEDAVAWITLEGTHYRLGDGEVESIIDFLPGLALDGSDALFASGTGVAVRSLVTGDVMDIGSDPSVTSVDVIAPAGDAVYWASTDTSDSQLRRIWRSERDGSSTIEIGVFRSGEAPYAFAVLGEHVYFAQATGGGNIVHRLARAYADGSEPIESRSDPIDSLANLVSDGTSLFATISPLDEEDAPSPGPHSVVRIATDGVVTTLFETSKIWWYPIYTQLAVDDAYLYWIGRTSATPTVTNQSIWRARKDGSGEPERVVDGLEDGENFIAINSSKIYLGLNCGGGVPILAIDKPL